MQIFEVTTILKRAASVPAPSDAETATARERFLTAIRSETGSRDDARESAA